MTLEEMTWEQRFEAAFQALLSMEMERDYLLGQLEDAVIQLEKSQAQLYIYARADHGTPLNIIMGEIRGLGLH